MSITADAVSASLSRHGTEKGAEETAPSSGSGPLSAQELVIDAIDRVPSLGAVAGHQRRPMIDARLAARGSTRAHGGNDPAITEWTWPS